MAKRTNKNLTTLFADKDTEQQQLLLAMGAIQNGATTLGDSLAKIRCQAKEARHQKTHTFPFIRSSSKGERNPKCCKSDC
jgi:hypothetical protein